MTEVVTQSSESEQPNGGNATPDAPSGFVLPTEYDWLKDPQKAYEAVTKLQSKSAERLNELAAERERLAKLEAEQRQRQESEMKEQNRFKELYEQALAELEKTKLLMQERETALQKRQIENAFILAANGKNIIDPDAALKLANLSGVKITDEGVNGVNEALETLIKERPYLVKAATGQAPVAPQIPPMNPAGGVAFTREAIEKMTPAQVIANWDAVQATIKTQPK